MQKIILIAGPTGSGKSEIALRLAKKINGEIINTDSMQVYKEIKILSARPESYSNVSHYLYGNISVKNNFSAFSLFFSSLSPLAPASCISLKAFIISGFGLKVVCISCLSVINPLGFIVFIPLEYH